MSPPSTQFAPQNNKNYHPSSSTTAIYDHLINLKKSNNRLNNKILYDDATNMRNNSIIKLNSMPSSLLDESSTSSSRTLSFSIDNNNNTVSISIDKKNDDRRSFENDNATILRRKLVATTKDRTKRRFTVTDISSNYDDDIVPTQIVDNKRENKLSNNLIPKWKKINHHIGTTVTNHAYMKRSPASDELNNLKQTQYKEHNTHQIPLNSFDEDMNWKSTNTSIDAKTNQHYFLLKVNNTNCNPVSINQSSTNTITSVDYKPLILNSSIPRRRFHTLPSGNTFIVKKKTNHQRTITNNNNNSVTLSFDMTNINAQPQTHQNENIVEKKQVNNKFNVNSAVIVNPKRLPNDKSTAVENENINVILPKKTLQTDERDLLLSSSPTCYPSDLSTKSFLSENDHKMLLLREISAKTDAATHNNTKIEKKTNPSLQQNDEVGETNKRKVVIKQYQQNDNKESTLAHYQLFNGLRQISTAANDSNQKGYRYKPIAVHYQTTHRLKTDKQQILEDETQRPTSYSFSFTKVTPKNEINYNVAKKLSSAVEENMDSNVMRLISRFDPKASVINKPRSLDQLKTCHTSFDRSPIIFAQSVISKSSIITEEKPNLERQPIVDENNISHRPIMKYNERTHTELVVEPQTTITTPLRIVTDNNIKNHVEPQHVYQPSITTIKTNTDTRPTRRACAALSKSEWDLRLQSDSTTDTLLSVEKASNESTNYRPLLSRSKSFAVIYDDEEGNDDVKSRPLSTIVRDGSCVEKLRQLFANKSSNDLRIPITPSTNQRILDNEEQLKSSFHYLNGDNNANRLFSDEPRIERSVTEIIPVKTKIDSLTSTNGKEFYNHAIAAKQNNDTNLEKSLFANSNNYHNKRNITKPAVIQQDQDLSVSHRIIKKPILKSQKTVECINSPIIINTTTTPTAITSSLRDSKQCSMPSKTATTDLSFDAYSFRRLQDHEKHTSVISPQKPYSTTMRNIAKVEPYNIHQQQQPQQSLSKSRNNTVNVRPLYNGNDYYQKVRNNNTSTPSALTTTYGMIKTNVQNSDFLVPNPAFSNNNNIKTSLSQNSLNLLSNNSNSHNDFMDPNRIGTKSLVRDPDKFMPHQFTNTKYQKLDYNHPSSYNYQHQSQSPLISASPYSTHTNGKQSVAPSRTITTNPIPNEEDTSSGKSRRRFHRRKQIKRSKSVDLCQLDNDRQTITPSSQLKTNSISYSQHTLRSSSRQHLDNSSSRIKSHHSSSSETEHQNNNNTAILRYKSLDSVTCRTEPTALLTNMNNVHTKNIKTNGNRSRISKVNEEIDFDSDDSVCGIPKPIRKYRKNLQDFARHFKTVYDFSRCCDPVIR
ncbi:unnamed protein product [Didymodactylos carnosus]|uniref:Uncharacterized protein n=1 Tax=Didymodactylos carnosus TaxID=1234261 RepID=A0A8S2GDZ2_9BILA|nr:unnamed protein product [Didymodactylos carnosus]CAF3500266.1 unnamed protein product [Didymodactylos carnosus]